MARQSKKEIRPFRLYVRDLATLTAESVIFSYPSEFLDGADEERLISSLAFYVSGI